MWYRINLFCWAPTCEAKEIPVREMLRLILDWQECNGEELVHCPHPPQSSPDSVVCGIAQANAMLWCPRPSAWLDWEYVAGRSCVGSDPPVKVVRHHCVRRAEVKAPWHGCLPLLQPSHSRRPSPRPPACLYQDNGGERESNRQFNCLCPSIELTQWTPTSFTHADVCICSMLNWSNILI